MGSLLSHAERKTMFILLPTTSPRPAPEVEQLFVLFTFFFTKNYSNNEHKKPSPCCIHWSVDGGYNVHECGKYNFIISNDKLFVLVQYVGCSSFQGCTSNNVTSSHSLFCLHITFFLIIIGHTGDFPRSELIYKGHRKAPVGMLASTVALSHEK